MVKSRGYFIVFSNQSARRLLPWLVDIAIRPRSVHVFEAKVWAQNPSVRGLIQHSIDCGLTQPYLVVPRSLQSLSRPNGDLTSVRHWVQTCRGSEHQECESYRRVSRSLPTRLLQIKTTEPDTIRLVSTEGQTHFDYVTLSHRWGSEPSFEPPKLSDHNGAGSPEWLSATQLKAGIAIHTLPRLFQDVINIVKKCDLTYLWIDCLCILQDRSLGGENLDWQKESSKMGDIYAGAIL